MAIQNYFQRLYHLIMGVDIASIILKKEVELSELRDKVIAVDGNGELYQFLALIRMPNGTPLKGPDGNVTSHLVGLFYRTTRLISEYGIKLVFVFDGKPPERKSNELRKRKKIKEKYMMEYEVALAEGDLKKAFSKATMTSRLTPSMVEDAKKLLSLLGIPFVQAPSEGEAQASFMVKKGDAWATGSKDYDSLLFGTPRLARFITISGREFLPSKGMFRPLKPEIIEMEDMLRNYRITHEQLIDISILIGTDFNEGVKGIGPKKAMNLIKEFGCIENLPDEIKEKVEGFEEIRKIFLHPDVTEDYKISYGNIDEKGLIKFLWEEKGFSRQRVENAIERMGSKKLLF